MLYESNCSAMYGYPEMNLIGKKPEEYTIDEIVHSKKYRQFMHNKIIDNDIVIDYSKVISKDILQYHINNGDLKPLYLISPVLVVQKKKIILFMYLIGLLN